MLTIVSDFDRTFYTDEYKNNIVRINEFVNCGNMFVIATGRNLEQLKNDLDDSILYSYLICNDGAVIYDNKFNIINEIDIDEVTGKKLYDDLIDKNIETYIDNGYTLINSFTTPVNGVIGRIDSLSHSKMILNYVLENYPSIGGYISTHWINLTNKEVNKARGIKYLEDNRDLKNIYTIGDDINDIEMLKSYNGYKIVSDIVNLEEITNKVSNFIEFVDMITK